MITNYFTRPQLWMPAYNPIIWSFVSDETTQPDFSYIVDVYVAAVTAPTTYSYRLVQKPNPTGNCIVDVSSIVQGFFDMTNFYGDEYKPPTLSQDPQYARYGYGNDPGSEKWNAIASVYIVVGEQYSVNGVLTTFDGFGSVGNPGYDLYSNYVSEPVRVIPGALPYKDSVANLMAASLADSFYAPYIMDGNGKFLTRLGPIQDIARTQVHTLCFLNWWDQASNPMSQPVAGVIFKSYSANGTLLGSTIYPNIVNSGGGPRTSFNGTIPATFDLSMAALSVAVGPREWGPPAGTAYYTAELVSRTFGTGSYDITSEAIRFNIVEYCEDLFPVVRVGWLNDLGGKDYYNFTMFYEKTTSSPDETWYQPEINWDGATPYPTSVTGSWWLRGGFKSFGKSVTTSFVLQTDFVLQETVDALGQIFESPLVWAYIGVTSQDPIALQVTGIDYTYTTVKLVKLVQVTLECQFNKIQPKQIL